MFYPYVLSFIPSYFFGLFGGLSAEYSTEVKQINDSVVLYAVACMCVCVCVSVCVCACV